MILALAAAAANAPAEEARDQPARDRADEPGIPPPSKPPGSQTAEPDSVPTSQPAGGRTAEPDALPTSQPAGGRSPETDALPSSPPAPAVDTPRSGAAQSLGLRNARSALVPLSRAARHDPKPAVRRAASLALGQIRSSIKAGHDTGHAMIPDHTSVNARTVVGARANAGKQRPFVFSVNGPGQGEGAIGLGGRMIQWVIPCVDLNYARGLTDDLALILNLYTFGIISQADLGLRFRLLGSHRFGLAVKAAAALSGGGSRMRYFGADEDDGFSVAAMPGLAVSFGSPRTQFSLGVDVPLVLWSTSSNDHAPESGHDGADFVLHLRPTATVELSRWQTMNLYLQAMVSFSVTEEDVDHVWPTFAMGVAW